MIDVPGFIDFEVQRFQTQIRIPAVGQVLTVPSYPGATYQWLRAGTAIVGATSNTYTVATADTGLFLTVQITPAGVQVAGVPPGLPPPPPSGSPSLDFSKPANSQYGQIAEGMS